MPLLKETDIDSATTLDPEDYCRLVISFGRYERAGSFDNDRLLALKEVDTNQLFVVDRSELARYRHK